MKPRLQAALFTVLLLSLPPAWAHQQKEAITRVLFNARTGNIEVMHRFLLHDAEHAVKKLRHGDSDILGSPVDQAFFSDYVYQHFAISDQDGKVLPLTPVGHEIEGRFIWVYAETSIPATIESLSLRHDSLRDIWPEQVNLVNVERNGVVQSATFMGGNTELTIKLTQR